jgi:hypothetical protein
MSISRAPVQQRRLAQARFTDINLSGLFDNIDFTNAAITKNCNFTGMTIAGIAVSELLAAYRSRPK